MDKLIDDYMLEQMPKFRFKHETCNEYDIPETVYIFENYAVLCDPYNVGVYYNAGEKKFVFGFDRTLHTSYFCRCTITRTGPLGNLIASNDSFITRKKIEEQDFGGFLQHLNREYKVEPGLTANLSYINVCETTKNFGFKSRHISEDAYILKRFMHPKYSSMVLYLSDPDEYISVMESHFKSKTWDEFRKLSWPKKIKDDIPQNIESSNISLAKFLAILKKLKRSSES